MPSQTGFRMITDGYRQVRGGCASGHDGGGAVFGRVRLVDLDNLSNEWEARLREAFAERE
jgi:hypothetical protein